MLILPAEQTVDWRKPPFATLILILLNVFIYFNLQHKDDDLWEQAYDYYSSSSLVELEAPMYVEFLRQSSVSGSSGQSVYSEEVSKTLKQGNIDSLIPLMLEDKAFVAYLSDFGRRLMSADAFQQWQQHRFYIEDRFLGELSYWKMGLVPAHIQLPDLISHQFLHGNLSHLLGNMVVLFIVGFAIEMILGKALFLVAYLTCGAAGGLIFSLTENQSLIPLVGASGAISGLMGMYVMYYRLQRIRFFYFIVVYFNYFRAPALLILPVWLGKEVYEYMTNASSPVAYMAHIGGLLAGAAFMWPWVKWQHNSTQDNRTEEEVDLAYRESKSKALEALSEVDFNKARELFTHLHQEFPSDESITLHLFHLYKLRPGDPECQHYTQLVLDSALRQGKLKQAYSILEEFQKYSDGTPLSDQSFYLRLLNGCFNSNLLKEAETILDRLNNTMADKHLLIEAYSLAAQTFGQQQLQLKARKYQQQLNDLIGQP